MFNKSRSYYFPLFLLWLTGLPATVLGQTEDLSEKIWTSIGGKQHWENARYFMFTCQGPHKPVHQRPASYLWDRFSGDCRYEGTTTDQRNLVVLFNLHRLEGQVYIDNVIQDDSETIKTKINNVRQGFKKDAELLFLPAIQDGESVRLSLEAERLVGASRQLVAQIKNEGTVYDADAEGTLYVDAHTGRITRWNPRGGVSYDVSGYKDIGGGLFLPTRFVAVGGGQQVVYSVAASLVHIEAEKFTQP